MGESRAINTTRMGDVDLDDTDDAAYIGGMTSTSQRFL
jgi:hypothetical protein